jgi:hypothetical protein
VLVRTIDKSKLVDAMALVTCGAGRAAIGPPPAVSLRPRVVALIFIINVPIGFLGFFLVNRFVNVRAGRQSDFVGMALVVAVAGLAFGTSVLGPVFCRGRRARADRARGGGGIAYVSMRGGRRPPS